MSTHKLSILIIEDELVIAENTKLLILQLYPACEVRIAGDSTEAKQSLQDFKPDLALLDIRLGEKESGINLSDKLIEKGIPFIFVTAHGDLKTISDAVKKNPFGYMIKPVSRQDLFANLELAFAKLGNENYYIFRDGTHDVRIAEKNIVYLNVDGNYTEIHTKDKRYVIRKSMTKVIDELHVELMQIHRKCFVNPSYIKEANASVYLSTGEVLPLSRNYKKDLLQKVFHIAKK